MIASVLLAVVALYVLSGLTVGLLIDRWQMSMPQPYEGLLDNIGLTVESKRTFAIVIFVLVGALFIASYIVVSAFRYFLAGCKEFLVRRDWNKRFRRKVIAFKNAKLKEKYGGHDSHQLGE